MKIYLYYYVGLPSFLFINQNIKIFRVDDQAHRPYRKALFHDFLVFSPHLYLGIFMLRKRSSCEKTNKEGEIREEK